MNTGIKGYSKGLFFMLIGLLLVATNSMFAKANGNGNGNGKQSNGNGHGFACEDLKQISDLKIDSKHPTIALFYSQTCPSCHDIKEPFNKYVTKHKGKVNCVAIDVNGAGVRDFARMLKVEAVPTLVVIHKHVGFFGDAALESYLNQMTGMTAFSQSNGGTQVVPSKEIPAIPGALVNEGYLEEEEKYLFPTDKPLAVRPEEIEDMDIDEELSMDVIPSNTGMSSRESSGDVMP